MSEPTQTPPTRPFHPWDPVLQVAIDLESEAAQIWQPRGILAAPSPPLGDSETGATEAQLRQRIAHYLHESADLLRQAHQTAVHARDLALADCGVEV